MVVIRVQLFEQRNASPATAEDNQLRLLFLPPLRFGVIIVKHHFDDR